MKSLKKVLLVLASVMMLAGLSVTASAAQGTVPPSPASANLKKAAAAGKVTVSGTTYEYNKKGVTPKAKDFTVVVGGVKLIPGVDFTIKAHKHTTSGTYALKIIGKGKFKGTWLTSYTIQGPKEQNVTVSLKKGKTEYTVAAGTTALKKQKTATLKVKGAKGKVSYSVVKSTGSGKVKVSKDGKVTLKKGLKKGTYVVKVSVAGKGKYNPASVLVTFTIK